MANRLIVRASRLLTRHNLTGQCLKSLTSRNIHPHRTTLHTHQRLGPRSFRHSAFHTSARDYAQPATADALIENINDLYATAKDEFEIAAEETEKKTVYAAEDREGCQEAFQTLKEAYESALKDHGPDVGKEVEGRIGQRIRELQNAITAMEESAMED